ncbi:MAG: hypothetical protein MI921_03675 [Cytophagales bacterium]|nr:hypothetical protein [Cytophagales bacterium]
MAFTPNFIDTTDTGSGTDYRKDQESAGLGKRIFNSNFWIRLTHWEYWPFYLLYLPVFIYWVGLVLRARSAFFFSAANPTIENGGMLGESKIKILNTIAPELIPETMYFQPGTSKFQLLAVLKKNGVDFPFILKPDIGERGSFVEKIKNEDDLDRYLKQIKIPFLAQEYIDFPIEMGVFYYRYPSNPKGKVSSIVLKQMLNVTGDGKKTIRELILMNPRAKLQLAALEKSLGSDLDEVLANGEERELESIGNHCRGTAFLNGNYLINDQLNEVFDKISKSIEGFYFGRYDLRCSSLEDLYRGTGIKIMELNGAGSEPGHIYHPGTSIWIAYRDIFHHLEVLLKISKENHRLGVPYMTLATGIREIKKLRAYNRLKNA